MQKRGQITVFLIVGVVLLITVGLFFYLGSDTAKAKSSVSAKKAMNPEDTNIVREYVESCLKLVGDDALFTRIGLQGGFIDPNGDSNYNEEGITSSPIIPSSVAFEGKNVPFYLEAVCGKYCSCTAPRVNCIDGCRLPVCSASSPCAFGTCLDGGTCNARCSTPIPPGPSPTCMEYRCAWTYKSYPQDYNAFKNSMAGKISNYSEVKFNDCFNKNTFKEVGIQIFAEYSKLKVNTKINEEDVTVSLDFPLTITIGSAVSQLNTFEVRLPIRLKKLYESSIDFINNVKTKTILDTNFRTEVEYDIKNDCSGYDKNVLTNVYIKTLPGSANRIVQFGDFSTFDNYNAKTYFFQIAVMKIDIINSDPLKNNQCTGVIS